jgi:hypothetical protein
MDGGRIVQRGTLAELRQREPMRSLADGPGSG